MELIVFLRGNFISYFRIYTSLENVLLKEREEGRKKGREGRKAGKQEGRK